MTEVLLIDNYDSFVHNLARYVRELGVQARVVRNDALSLADIADEAPQAIIVSPGPCTPAEAGISVPVIQHYAGRIPILGVCLGHQAIASALGGAIIRAPEPVHGRMTWIRHQQTPLFDGIPSPFQAARYHSLIVDQATLPGELNVTAENLEGVPMAIESDALRLFGVQFHPESVLTHFGHRLLANFLQLAGLTPRLTQFSPPAAASDRAVHSLGPSVSPVPWPAPLTDTLPQRELLTPHESGAPRSE